MEASYSERSRYNSWTRPNQTESGRPSLETRRIRMPMNMPIDPLIYQKPLEYAKKRSVIYVKESLPPNITLSIQSFTLPTGRTMTDLNCLTDPILSIISPLLPIILMRLPIPSSFLSIQAKGLIQVQSISCSPP